MPGAPYIPGAYPTTAAGRSAAPPRSQWGPAPGTAAGGSATRAGATATASGGAGGQRPITRNRAAGFSSRGRPTTGTMAAFDPFRATARAGAPTDAKSEPTKEDQVRDLERAISALLHESAAAAADGRDALALAKAKEASKRERHLLKQREAFALMDQANLDLTYCVQVNLAHMYHKNKMPHEAINTYLLVVKNKTFNQAGRLRVNMGNIYLELRMLPQAVKMYRMALDQVSQATNKELRMKILRNMGSAFILQSQFQDAVTSFETIMETVPDHQAAFNLVLCYYALGDKDKQRRAFQRLVAIPPPQLELTDDDIPVDPTLFTGDDPLKLLARNARRTALRQVLLAAKLIANSVAPAANNGPSGWDWLIETTKSSAMADAVGELELAKASSYLHAREYPAAVAALKAFERKEAPHAACAAQTNLAALAYLEGDLDAAEAHADAALLLDRYNARALTNAGNVALARGDMPRARELYRTAMDADAACTEAAYNLGLAYKKSAQWVEAAKVYERLHAVLRTAPDVVWHLGDVAERAGDVARAKEWYSVLVSLVPTDPKVLAKLGDLHVRDGDTAQAFHYYAESFRFHPCDIDVIAWLGAYYVDCDVYEQALEYFDRAAKVDPSEVKWPLLAASCLRRCGNYAAAMEAYQRIHAKWPGNVECVRFLVRIASDIGAKELPDWQEKLARLEARAQSGGGVGSAGTDAPGMGGAHAAAMRRSASMVAAKSDEAVAVPFSGAGRKMTAGLFGPAAPVSPRASAAPTARAAAVNDDDHDDHNVVDMLP
ncbi:Intraflagellar transport protein 88 [Allomyces arbusculus]|nr:Intraflagellar transport protein 88 [Allomyces arbusculus]